MAERRDILPNNEKLIARALYVYAPIMKALCKRRLLAPFGVPEPPFSWLRFAGVFAPWLGNTSWAFQQCILGALSPLRCSKHSRWIFQ